MEKLKDIKAEADKLDYDEARNQGIKTREWFVESYPKMTDWLEGAEKLHGAFLGISSISFTDERCVFLYKFESTYMCDFHNPKLEDGDKDTHVNLSYEAMNGFLTLYKLFQTDEDTRRFWSAIGISDGEIEEYLQDK